MSVVSALFALLASAIPIVIFTTILQRAAAREGRLRILLGTIGLGVVAFALASLIEGALSRWSGLHKYSPTIDLSVLLYAFLVAAPVEQGLKVAAVVPVLRSRHFREPVDGIIYASAAALGFIAAHNAVYLALGEPSGLAVLRALLAVPAHLFLAGAWGYALGRDPKKRLGGRYFDAAWVAATLFNGVYDHIVFARSGVALVAAGPILLCMGAVMALAARDLLRRGAAGPRSAMPRSEAWSRRGLLPGLTPPSIGAMRAALLRSERPLAMRWVVFGALVTTGVITVMLIAAVLIGNRVGVDFAAVDRGEGGRAGAAPFVFLGGGALSAFPIAGYLIARASSARSVIEPAISAGLAIAGSLVLLGLAAPISVVFAIAFAPIAFGLACAGAWIGMTR